MNLKFMEMTTTNRINTLSGMTGMTGMTGVTGNGHTNSIHPTDTGADWRRETMNAILRNRSEDGSPLYLLLAALQQHKPDYTSRQFCENEKRTLSAFGELLPDFTQILVPSFDTDKGKTGERFFGWWIGTSPTDGATYEVILINDSGNWLISGPSADEVNRLSDAAIEMATRNVYRCLCFTNSSWQDSPEMQEEIERVRWDDIVLAPSLLSDIQTNIDAFFMQKDLFRKLGFAWRRGILLVGPPGTGKTMLCKAAAQTYPNLPFLYVRDFGHYGSAHALRAIFEKARTLAPCILAIEDMDGLIQADSRTTFLNELDGFQNNDGLLIIASSNHPERIDEALLKRPSRFDRVYHIGLPDAPERREYARRVLVKSPMPIVDVTVETLADKIAVASDGFTPAFIKEAILSAMLSAAQNGKETLDASFGEAIVEQIKLLKTYLKKAKNPEAMAEMTAATAGDIGFRSR